MEFSNEIIKIFRRYRTNLEKIYLLPMTNGSSTTIDRLYRGVLEGKCATDSDASTYLYGKPENSPRFQFAKSIFRRAALNSIFFFDATPSTYVSEVTAAFFKNQKDLFWVKILLRLGARRSAIRIASRAYKTARTFEFTPNTIEFLNAL